MYDKICDCGFKDFGDVKEKRMANGKTEYELKRENEAEAEAADAYRAEQEKRVSDELDRYKLTTDISRVETKILTEAITILSEIITDLKRENRSLIMDITRIQNNQYKREETIRKLQNERDRNEINLQIYRDKEAAAAVAAAKKPAAPRKPKEPAETMTAAQAVGEPVGLTPFKV